MNRSEQRALRIRTEVPIEQVLASYGYSVENGSSRREQQFSCDLHGDGRDQKPSARCYPESNQWYCWACYTSRDAVRTVREKEGVGFVRALDLLEQRYRLPPLPWEDDGDGERGAPDPLSPLHSALQPPSRTPQQELDRARRLLESATQERDFPVEVLASQWERWDCLCSQVQGGLLAGWEEALWELRASLVPR